jgi:hypothetical protein
MFIKLEYKTETDKAYQLNNGSYIPKSILDNRGLKHPYYKIKLWWLRIQNENIRLPLEELLELGRKKKPTKEDIENSQKVMLGIQPLVISMKDIPEEIRNYWTKYWKSLSSYTPDYEPRLWGNDCFDGEMSAWFD